MNCRCLLLLVLGALLFGATARTQADVPVLDLSKVGAYRAALASSTDPRANRIRQEIADGPADLANAKAALAKDGVSLDPAKPAIPDGENAAPLYQKWTELSKPESAKLPLWAEPLGLSRIYTDDQITQVQSIMDSESDATAVLNQALSKPSMYIKTDSPLDEFPAIAQLRGAARQFTTEATLLALKGRWNDAALMQANGFIVEKQLTQVPGLLAHLVTIAIAAITLAGEQNILQHADPNAELSKTITEAVSSPAGMLSMKAALVGELPSCDAECDTILSELNKTPSGAGKQISPADEAFLTGLVDAYEAATNNALRQAIEIAGEPPLQRRADLQLLDQQHDEKAKDLSDPIVSTFGALMDYGKVAAKDDEITARQQVLLAAAAVLAAKASTGTFPTSLPGTFIDPYNDKPLIYTATANGFEVYSVGPTGQFNGVMVPGKTAAESAFVYPAPPKSPIPADELSE